MIIVFKVLSDFYIIEVSLRKLFFKSITAFKIMFKAVNLVSEVYKVCN